MTPLKVEINETFARTNDIIPLGKNINIMVTPLGLNEDYWLFRVRLHEDQAIVGFPKFTTVAIGFAKEEASWNTNLPYTYDATIIYEHIKKNKKYDEIADEQCLEAIKMIQQALKDIGEGKKL